MPGKFDNSIADSQATKVAPVAPRQFDFAAYREYADNLNAICRKFIAEESGVLVYRRMRVAECFSYGCRDRRNSLELQLGALSAGMKFKADVPNFLEPWYGIGTIPSAFGSEYTWIPGNAPAIKPMFSSVQEILDSDPVPVASTAIGKHTLEMVEYFMDQTKGMVPVSLTDSQSPLNMVSHLCPMEGFFTDMLLEPEKIVQLFDLLAGLSIEFNRQQRRLIGDALASPGHGFASSTEWAGLGMSDDNVLMISPDQYSALAVPALEKIGRDFGGTAFHSCGNWAPWIGEVLKIAGLKMADGAFTPETDPGYITDCKEFHRFSGTGVILNARMVGGPDVLEEKVKELWVPGLKLVVVTYCLSAEEQEEVYNRIHRICEG